MALHLSIPNTWIKHWWTAGKRVDCKDEDRKEGMMVTMFMKHQVL